MHLLTIEVWFYTTHRALHFPSVYKYVHKLHHKWKAPTAVACMFAHPFEFCVGNVLGVGAPVDDVPGVDKLRAPLLVLGVVDDPLKFPLELPGVELRA